MFIRGKENNLFQVSAKHKKNDDLFQEDSLHFQVQTNNLSNPLPPTKQRNMPLAAKGVTLASIVHITTTEHLLCVGM